MLHFAVTVPTFQDSAKHRAHTMAKFKFTIPDILVSARSDLRAPIQYRLDKGQHMSGFSKGDPVFSIDVSAFEDA